MITLTSTLSAYQKRLTIDPLIKVVLTQGANSYTYTRTRLMDVDHDMQPYKHTGLISLDNADATLTSLDFKGYKAVISYGINTSAGEEYVAQAPLWVVGQRFESSQTKLACVLECIGIPNLLAEDRAKSDYEPTSSDTLTVKTIITNMFNGTMTAFADTPTYTVNWSSEDSLIDSYVPKDGFRIYKNGSRLAALRRLLDYTGCAVRFGNDGQLYIFVPKISGTTWAANTAYILRDYVQPSTPNNNFTYRCTTAGTSHATTEPTWPTTDGGTVTDGTVVWTAEAHDYTYSLVSGEHNFFAKAYRQRLVIPNRIYVESQPDDSPQYTNNKADAASYDALGQYLSQYESMRLASSAQAGSIATALLGKYQMQADAGSGEVPMNIGAEVYDYVKITDSRENDTRIGNIGWIHRRVNLRKAEWRMTFGFGGWRSVRGLVNDMETDPSGFGAAGQYFAKLAAKDLYAENIKAGQIDLTSLDQDDIGDGTTYGRLRNTNLSAGNIKLTSVVTADGKWYDVSGVRIDADSGILLYGSSTAFRIRASSAGVDQVYADASGNLLYTGSSNLQIASVDSYKRMCFWGLIG